MDSNLITTLLIFFHVSFLPLPSLSAPLYTEFIYPNFTASHFQFIDNSGAFLTSRNTTFKAAIVDPNTGGQSTHFYFSIIHVASNQVIWSANRNSPISTSGKLTLNSTGISIIEENGQPIWSTPQSKSPVRALQLQESGNLVLLDSLNRSIWQSFDYPTDTIVAGQRLAVGVILLSVRPEYNMSTSDYSFMIIESDAVLQWNGQTFWKLSMDTSTFQDSNSPVAYMKMNETGLYLIGGDEDVVYNVVFNYSSGFRIAQLTSDGRFYVKTYFNGEWSDDLVGPSVGDDCQIPNFCGGYGLCTSGSNAGSCSCPSGFYTNTGPQGCLPSNGGSLPPGCGKGNSTNGISYEKLSYGLDYFLNDFSVPMAFGQTLFDCQEFCSKNCSCFGYFYAQSSGSCYLLNNPLGSFFTVSGETGRSGYIKTIVPLDVNTNFQEEKSGNLSMVGLVLIPLSAVVLLAALSVVGFLMWRKSRISRSKEVKLGRRNSNSLTDYDAFSIPGLPVRFEYEELDVGTNNFLTKIGSGGFGDVYKGTLPDKTIVAVKKITNSTNQGKKEFCTEIAVIGNIHHVNLVKLRGFCAQGRERILVYEYMSRGSLDRTLFGAGPVLEWQERFDIAVGTARGLAYLHGGCEQKIIHCDIKPENILLNDYFQVKISDFGLSKLLSPEQSSHFTTMRGTRGYLAPEWLTSSTISDKTDVYSFGMVLLEIVSGRKNCSTKTQSLAIDIDNSNAATSSPLSGSLPDYFPLFALEMHEQRKYMELADPKLEGRVMNEEIEMLVRVALCCVHEDPMLRPSMANVVSMLEGGIPLGEPRVDGLNFLRFYGRRFTEASTMGRCDGGNVFPLFPETFTTRSSTTASSHNSLSYMSSQQISGPR